ncbi:MAG: 1-acyl-sn-glycerol-3-phosphate acyltransferase [Bacteroidales bacterium]|nr:1-acyl-sn-glycerol-3-phosphate acyltransferase [Bacteroidales bacterium]
MTLPNFDDIRPYVDAEVAPAMERIASNPMLQGISAYLFPGKDVSYFKNILLSCKTIDDFQENVMQYVVKKILSDTAKNLTYGGLEYFDGDKKYLIVTNHRDIVLDSAIIQIILYMHNIQTTEIAVGDNLISSSFMEDATRTNKMIKVVRNTTLREVYASSQKLSQYIRHSVSTNKSSIWIAQRNGRTKDGWDVTEQGVLKMLDMSGSKDFVKDFGELSIMPASISYELEPCDLLKCVELYISKRRKYVKSKDEDFNSILTGIMQFKGNIHIEFTKPITHEEIEQAAQLDKNERFKFLTSAMDKRIVSSFKLWKNNYIAYDMITGSNEFAAEYTQEEKKAFVDYMKFKLSSAEGDMDELEDIFLHIYANPIFNRKSIQ